MNRRDRALTALDHREPDIVPIWELGVDPPHVEAITGKQWITSSKGTTLDKRGVERHNADLMVECYNKLGFVMIRAAPSDPDDWKPQRFPDGTFTDEWGRIRMYDPRTKSTIPFRTLIKTPEDFEAMPFPDVHALGRLHGIEYIVKQAKKEMAVAAEVRAPFATAWEMFGVTGFCQILHEKPQFIRKVIEKMTDFNIELIKMVVDAGADMIVSNGDIAEKNGPMVSPRYFSKIFLPNMKRERDTANRKGVKFVKHTDGDLNPIMEGLANTVDGLHSLDPSANMDIAHIKKKYGKRLVLMGNVSVDKLCRGTKEEIVKDTRECIRVAAPEGGYFLNSSNTWYADAKLENCMTMVETGRKYGKYPIKL